jgi:hypothetical protein
MSSEAWALYERITQGYVPVPEDGPALRELEEFGLVRVTPNGVVLRDPREAAQARLREELAALAERALRASALPALGEALGVAYDRSRWHSGSSEYLAERDLVNARIGDVVARAETEILAAQPDAPRTQEFRDAAVERDSKALGRGVQMRTLYRDSVRSDSAMSEWAAGMSVTGGQFRTTAAPFERCIIVDRKDAFIVDYVTTGGPEHASWHVTDPAVVPALAASFDDMWRRADPWTGDTRTGVELVATRTSRQQREILRDTAAGVAQSVTARRLGIGVRTVTREIGVLRELWGVANVAELTYQWALSPDRLLDDQEQVLDGSGAALV